MTSLYSIAKENYSNDPVTKPLRYYEIYDQVLREEQLSPKAILEIGIYEGESTRALARRFPDARIIAIDLELKKIDFSGYCNVTYVQCDQTDSAKLKAICDAHFPDGLDLVVEDASHIGHFSRVTFDAVFPSLRSGGLYIVEDWGTGYWANWVDGGSFSEPKVPSSVGQIATTIPSHHYGMVGFIKSLVDYTAVDDIISHRSISQGGVSRLAIAAGRVGILRKLVGRLPSVKRFLVRLVNAAENAHGISDRSATQARELPRLKSLKIFRGVCIACKE